MADQRFTRKPVGNFFVKKSLQIGLIVKIMAVSLLSSLVSSGALLLVYYMRHQSVAIYAWDQATNGLQKHHIIDLILPTLIISFVVGLTVSFGIGLYASRKYAVPVYKIENWASMLQNGKMTAVLRFREKDEMRELTQKCNELGMQIRDVLLEIKNNVETMQKAGVDRPELKAISAKLNGMELTNEVIEIKSPIAKDND